MNSFSLLVTSSANKALQFAVPHCCVEISYDFDGVGEIYLIENPIWGFEPRPLDLFRRFLGHAAKAY